jgi:hypothetical protein
VVLSYVLVYEIQTIRGRIRPPRESSSESVYQVLVDLEKDDPVIPIQRSFEQMRYRTGRKQGGSEPERSIIDEMSPLCDHNIVTCHTSHGPVTIRASNPRRDCERVKLERTPPSINLNTVSNRYARKT